MMKIWQMRKLDYPVKAYEIDISPIIWKNNIYKKMQYDIIYVPLNSENDLRQSSSLTAAFFSIASWSALYFM